MTRFEVIFDTETKKFFDAIEEYDPSKLGVSLLSLYAREVDENLQEIKGEMKSFWEGELRDAWEIFEKADRIIGFNSIGFDVPALSPYSSPSFAKLPHFDILAHIKASQGKRVSLDSLARASLGTKKIDSGENAIKYFEKGDKESLAKLKKYCEADVAITRDIYDYGAKNGFLKFIDFWNETHDVKVDFSYSEDNLDEVQTSLF